MKPIEQRIACAKGEILNAMATISTEHDLSATVMEGVLADILSEVKSQSKMELLNAYNKEVNDAQQEIKASTQSWHWKTDATCQAATDQETDQEADQAIIQLYHTEQQRQRHSLDM